MKTVLHIGSGYKKGGGGAFVLRETLRLLENHTINYLIAVDCGNSETLRKQRNNERNKIMAAVPGIAESY